MNSDSSRTVILSIASSRSSCVRTAMSVSLSVAPAGRRRGHSWLGAAVSARSRLGLGLRVAHLGERVAKVADVGREETRQGRERRLHPTGQLREEDLTRWQAGKGPDAF